MIQKLNFAGDDFTEDIDSFIKSLEGEDEKFAKILKNHLQVLLDYPGEDSTASARTQFNKAVLADLQALAKEDL